MQLQRFVRWCETAGSRERAEGFAVLAREYVDGGRDEIDRAVLESVLLLGLDDPSPRVRLALAEVLGTNPSVPRPIVRALLLDEPAIAFRVAGSPSLRDEDLVEALERGGLALQPLVARRDRLSRRPAEWLVANGTAEACEALLDNSGVDLDADTLRRLADRHGGDAAIRRALALRDDLPADVRQLLILETGRSLQASAFLDAVLGPDLAARTVFDACERATSRLAETVETPEVPALVDHLRRSGQLSAAFILRSACAGHIDLVAAALTALSGLSERRVHAILVEGREVAFRSLVLRSGLPAAMASLLRIVVRNWKAVATDGAEHSAEDVPELVMRRVSQSVAGEATGQDGEGVRMLLRRLAAETSEDAMRFRMRRLMAA